MFHECEDPLAGHRSPVDFAGEPAVLSVVATARKASRKRSAPTDAAEALPSVLPPPSDDARELAAVIHDRWLDGGRIEQYSWLHLAAWCLGAKWTKGDIGAMLELLDADEPDESKRSEHTHILGNAHANDGPGGAREWLESDFDAVDAIRRTSRVTSFSGDCPSSWSTCRSGQHGRIVVAGDGHRVRVGGGPVLPRHQLHPVPVQRDPWGSMEHRLVCYMM